MRSTQLCVGDAAEDGFGLVPSVLVLEYVSCLDPRTRRAVQSVATAVEACLTQSYPVQA